MRRKAPPWFFWLGVLALTGVLATFAVGSVVPVGELLPPPTPARARPTAAAAQAGGALLSDARGFVAVTGTAPTLRRETSIGAVGSLHGHGFIGAVSATGRRVAYWSGEAARDLRVLDVTAPEEETPLTALLDIERGTGAAWSIDRTGLLVTVESSGRPASGDSPGTFSALRIIDAPTRVIHEVARLTDGGRFVPVGWDRDSRLTGSCIVSVDGSAAAWAIIGEDAILSARIAMEPGLAVPTVQASGKAVLGVVNDTLVRVWSLASYSDHRELGADPGERIAFARWRPGAAEIVVSVADRLEVWPAGGGARRTVARGLPAASGLVVSIDGQIAVLTIDGGRSAIAVEVETGRTALIPLAGDQLVAAISFR
jgi:hypothetical protein